MPKKQKRRLLPGEAFSHIPAKGGLPVASQQEQAVSKFYYEQEMAEKKRSLMNSMYARANNIDPFLVKSNPQAAMDLLKSRMPSSRLPQLSQVLQRITSTPDYKEWLQQDATIGFMNAPAGFYGGRGRYGKLLQGLPEEYQNALIPVLNWLSSRVEGRQGVSGFGAFINPEDDVLALSSLILDVEPGENILGLKKKPTIVLREAVHNMLARGMDRDEDVKLDLTPGQEQENVGIELARGRYTLPKGSGTPATDKRKILGDKSDPQYVRALMLVSFLQEAFGKKANIRYQSGGVLGTLNEKWRETVNAFSIPTATTARIISEGVRGHPIDPRDLLEEELNTQGYNFGEQAAKSIALKPGTTAYNVASAAFEFIYEFAAGPDMLWTQAGRGFKMAREIPNLGQTIPGSRGANELFRVLGRSPEEIMRSDTGNDIVRSIEAFIKREGDDAAISITNKYKQIGANRAQQLIEGYRSGGIEEVRAQLMNSMNGIPDIVPKAASDRMANLFDQRNEIMRGLEKVKPGSMEEANLIARQHQVVKKLRGGLNTKNVYIIRETPTPSWSHAVKNRASADVVSGRLSRPAGMLIEKMANASLPGTRFNIASIWHELPKEDLINFHAPGMSGRVDESLHAIKNFLIDYRVTDKDVKAILNKFVKTRGSGEFFEVLTEDVPNAIARSKNVPPSLKNDIIQFFNEQRQMYGQKSVVTAEGITEMTPTIWRKVVDEATQEITKRSMPSRYSQLVGSTIRLPHHRAALEATSWFRKSVASHADSKFWKATGATGKFLHDFERAVSGGWKWAILVPRGPAVVGRQFLDQWARVMAWGYAGFYNDPLKFIQAVTNRGMAENFDMLFAARGPLEGQFERLIGTIGRQAVDDYVTHSGTARAFFRGTRGTERKKAIGYLQAHLREMAEDPMMRVLTHEGTEGAVKWAKETEEGQEWVRQLEHSWSRMDDLAEGADPVTELIKANADELETITGGNVALKNAIWRKQVEDGNFARDRHNALVSTDELQIKLDNVKDRIHILEETGEDATSLRLQAKSLREQARDIKRLEKQNPPRASLYSDDFVDYVEKLIDEGSFIPPSEILFKEAAPRWAGASSIARFRDWSYHNMLSRWDVAGSRAPTFRIIAEHEYKNLRRLGYNNKTAREVAGHWAAKRTGQIMYDLSARTSAQAFWQQAFPFLPAWSEILKTWLHDVPNSYGRGFGHLMLANKARLVAGLATNMGFSQDSMGNTLLGQFVKQVIPVRIDKLLVGNVKETMTAVGGPFPGLGPWPKGALQLLSKRFSIAKDIGEAIIPFGLDSTLAPTYLNNIWLAVMGKPFPLEFAPSLAEHQYELSKKDAIRWATRMEVEENGWPEKQAKETDAQFKERQAAWVKKVEGRAYGHVKGIYWMRALSTLSPISVSRYIAQDNYKKDLEDYYEGVKRFKGDPEMLELWKEAWIQEHPNGEAYLQPSTVKVKDYKPEDVADSYDAILKGLRRVLSDDELLYATVHFRNRQVIEWNERKEMWAAGLRSPSDIIHNWRGFSEIRAKYAAELDSNNRLNPKGAEVWHTVYNKGEIPKQSAEVELLFETSRDLRAIEGLISQDDEEVIDADAISTLRRGIFDRLSKLGAIRESNNPMTQAYTWYFEKVLDPYYTHIEKLSRKVENAPLGVQANMYLDAMRRFKDRQDVLTGPDGSQFLTPEEFSWNNKEPEEKAILRLRWAGSNPTYRTRFQRRQLGLPFDDQSSEFLEAIAKIDREMYQTMTDKRIYATSRQGESLERQADAMKLKIAKNMGLEDFLGEINSPPMYRIQGLPGVPKGAHEAFRYARYVQDRILQDGHSIRGHSELADYLKRQFFVSLDSQMAHDKPFRHFMVDLRTAWGQDFKMRRWEAYDKLFFGETRFFVGTRPTSGIIEAYGGR
jgi:hypothetical protein